MPEPLLFGPTGEPIPRRAAGFSPVDEIDRLSERLKRDAGAPIVPTTLLLSPRQYREAQACGGVDEWMRQLWAEVPDA